MELSRWREMQEEDLPAVAQVAAVVHPRYPESDAVFAERRALYPRGSRVLAQPDGVIIGYVVSHPWMQGVIPALNSLLGALPATPETYYIHDIALRPEARGQGAAQAAIAALADHAARAGYVTMSIVAIAGTQGFWERQGFVPVDAPALAGKLASYDATARYMTRAL